MCDSTVWNRFMIFGVGMMLTLGLALFTSAEAANVTLRGNVTVEAEEFGGTVGPEDEQFGGKFPFENPTGEVVVKFDTVNKTYDYDLSVIGVFIADFLNNADKIPDGRPFIDPAAPNYTPAHIHNNEVGENGLIVLLPARPPAETLDGGVIPFSADHPCRDTPFGGFPPGGLAEPKRTMDSGGEDTGFNLTVKGAPVPETPEALPDDTEFGEDDFDEKAGPLSNDLNANGIIAQGLAGRLYTNVHSSFFETQDDGTRLCKGQDLPNGLMRAQLIPTIQGRKFRAYYLVGQVARPGEDRARRFTLLIPSDDLLLFFGEPKLRGPIKKASMIFDAGLRGFVSRFWRLSEITGSRSVDNDNTSNDTSTVTIEMKGRNIRGDTIAVTVNLEVDHSFDEDTGVVDDVRLQVDDDPLKRGISITVNGEPEFAGCSATVGRYAPRRLFRSIVRQAKAGPPRLDLSCLK